MQQWLPGRIQAEIAERDLAVKDLLKQAPTSRKHLSRLRRRVLIFVSGRRTGDGATYCAADPTLHKSGCRHNACLPGIHQISPELTGVDWD
jgi:hypothetical protein